MRKPQSNSVLKTLHPARQRTLWLWLQKESLEEVRKKLSTEWSLKTSERALSEFYSWYPFSSKLEEFSDLTAQVTAELAKNPDLDLDSEKVSKAGQAIFETLAAKTQDSKLFLELRRLRLKDRDQQFAHEKFSVATCATFIKWSKDDKARAIATSNISNQEKISQLRRHFFSDIDALEKSGQVKLPK